MYSRAQNLILTPRDPKFKDKLGEMHPLGPIPFCECP
jgi:hypothetical protein